MSRLTLWVRAGTDNVSMSGDPTAHHLFMLMLYKKAADASLVFDVKVVNEAKPPPEFREAGLRRAPALQIAEDEALSYEDEILEHLEQFQPKKVLDSMAEDATADLFRHFAFFIKDVNKDKECKALNTELLRINDFLSSTGRLFLCGDEMSGLDCLVLTRLHSIRIAAKALKDFDIPSELSHLWRYMNRGYESEEFKISCPSDQEIILHWSDRPDTVSLPSAKRAQIARQKPTFTRSIPV